jgi:hypothetical protein
MDGMRSWVSLVLGVLLILVGGLWTLQGLDVFGQSGGMNGSSFWAVVGAIVVLVGAWVLWRGIRRRRA